MMFFYAPMSFLYVRTVLVYFPLIASYVVYIVYIWVRGLKDASDMHSEVCVICLSEIFGQVFGFFAITRHHEVRFG